MSDSGPRNVVIWGIACETAAAHQAEPGGCTCGFCVWSGEHVALMVAGAIESAAARDGGTPQ